MEQKGAKAHFCTLRLKGFGGCLRFFSSPCICLATAGLAELAVKRGGLLKQGTLRSLSTVFGSAKGHKKVVCVALQPHSGARDPSGRC